MIQPIVARAVKGAQDRYEIVAGERRWRAAQLAGLHEVPIVPVDVSDSDALEIAIIENVQREDLNAMEEAQGYHALAGEFKRSQDDIAKIVGKSRSHVANMMRLTKLPAEVQAYIASGRLSAGHARALIGVPDPAAAAKRIVEEGLNVRQAEALAHVEGVPVRKPQKARGGKVKDPDTMALEKRVSDALGLAVSVDHRNPGGTVLIRYRDLEQLDEIVRRLDTGKLVFSASLASSFETRRFAMLLWMRSGYCRTLMVRSAEARVSNHGLRDAADSPGPATTAVRLTPAVWH